MVKRIFEEYLSGKGMDSIARDLTSEKVPTPSQVANKSNASPLWHASSIKVLLNNNHYCGDLVQSKTETITVTSAKRREINPEDLIIMEDTHEAIIPKETFKAVQEMMATRTRTATAPKKHLFTNVLYCEECQKGMWFKPNQKGYRCGGNIRHGETFCVNNVAVKEKELKHIILEDLKALFNSMREDSFMNSLLNKLNVKKNQLLKELHLHSLVEKVTCEHDGSVRIQYSFVNPLQKT
ncbi:recombinase family protein [Anaerobacillus sp. MEB173]|uniref:recombinase family protein n=1 Tax=Anaerobacillus sp. MEB173 TaxID=3383345 RepID=UPI003F8E3788